MNNQTYFTSIVNSISNRTDYPLQLTYMCSINNSYFIVHSGRKGTYINLVRYPDHKHIGVEILTRSAEATEQIKSRLNNIVNNVGIECYIKDPAEAADRNNGGKVFAFEIYGDTACENVNFALHSNWFVETTKKIYNCF